jgi:hypothetical protein
VDTVDPEGAGGPPPNIVCNYIVDGLSTSISLCPLGGKYGS